MKNNVKGMLLAVLLAFGGFTSMDAKRQNAKRQRSESCNQDDREVVRSKDGCFTCKRKRGPWNCLSCRQRCSARKEREQMNNERKSNRAGRRQAAVVAE